MSVQLRDVKSRSIVNPATGEQVGERADSSAEEVTRAVATAVDAQREWARMPRYQRAQLMRKYASIVHDHEDELARLLTKEQGKTVDQSSKEFGVHFRLFNGFADRMLAQKEEAHFRDTQPGTETDLQITRHEPLGVVAGIVPFNFPIELYSQKVAPAIAAGNAIVVKPSEETPLTTERLVGLTVEAGIPAGVVQAVFGGAEVGSALVADPRIGAVSFTGSTAAGVSVALSGARTLKKLLLELGGNDAMVVLPDADIDLVARCASFGRSLANGQCCISNKRLIVHRSVKEELVERLCATFAQYVVGDPSDQDTQIGPLITHAAASNVSSQVERTLEQGARLVAGGQRHGTFYEPTILDHVDSSMDIAHDMEIFGPVLPVIEFEQIDDAIRISNDTTFGLSGSVFTRDSREAMSVACQLMSGQVVVNGTGLYRSDAMGFGGYKMSGIGREGLDYSLDELTQLKTITFSDLV